MIHPTNSITHLVDRARSPATSPSAALLWTQFGTDGSPTYGDGWCFIPPLHSLCHFIPAAPIICHSRRPFVCRARARRMVYISARVCICPHKWFSDPLACGASWTATPRDVLFFLQRFVSSFPILPHRLLHNRVASLYAFWRDTLWAALLTFVLHLSLQRLQSGDLKVKIILKGWKLLCV